MGWVGSLRDLYTREGGGGGGGEPRIGADQTHDQNYKLNCNILQSNQIWQ